MYPAYLIRAGIDWVRNNEDFKEYDPVSRCLQTIKTCQELWQEQRGLSGLELVEPACVTSYWAEFFYANNPLAKDVPFKDELTKQSSQHNSFNDWQNWFKGNYGQSYKDDACWLGLLTSAWAHTHQLEVIYSDNTLEFKAATPYLQTEEFWRFEPHMDTVTEILNKIWTEEKALFEEHDFMVEEHVVPYLGKPECLAFDIKRYTIIFPAWASQPKEVIELGEIFADIILPAGNKWYRTMNSVLFTHEYLDASALIAQARYVIQSRRRFMELAIDTDIDKARQQTLSEGWLVNQVS